MRMPADQAAALGHGALCDAAGRWLRSRFRCSLVLVGLQTVRTAEQPDAIGWLCGGWSVLVECKASRADFRRDRRKWFRFRHASGMGQERWFFAPPGVVPADELPEGWGLAEPADGRVRLVRRAAGTVLDRSHRGVQDDAVSALELNLLLGALAKVHNGYTGALCRALQMEVSDGPAA